MERSSNPSAALYRAGSLKKLIQKGVSRQPEYLPVNFSETVFQPLISIHCILLAINIFTGAWLPMAAGVCVLLFSLMALHYGRGGSHYWLVPVAIFLVPGLALFLVANHFPEVALAWAIAINFFAFATMHFRIALVIVMTWLVPLVYVFDIQLGSFITIRFSAAYLLTVYFLYQFTKAIAGNYYQAVQLSRTDPLTGLYNRRAFIEEIERWLARNNRHPGAKVTLVMLDIDYFKKLNDSLGHQFGDKVLQAFADKLHSFTRGADIAARYGGEEFVLLLPETNAKGAHQLLQSLRYELAQHPLCKEQNIQFSAGISELRTQDSLDTWLNRVDTALYQVKNSGRNHDLTA
jgi:diguanylate cyclase (GGDEF)-like protein